MDILSGRGYITGLFDLPQKTGGMFEVSPLMYGREGREVRVNTAEAGVAETTANPTRAWPSMAAAAIAADSTQDLEKVNSAGARGEPSPERVRGREHERLQETFVAI